MNALQDSRVVVIGGSSGMGLAVARAAALAGARVTVAGRDAQRLAAAVAAIGCGAQGRTLDICDEAAVEAFFAAGPTIDHLVVSAHAGSVVTGALESLADMPLAAARAFFETKFWGPFTAVKYGQHKLAANGSIVLFSGAAGARKLLPNHGAIGATNGAVEAFARQMAKELAPRRVNVVAPGLVPTPAYDGLTAQARAEMLSGYAKNALVGRVGTPEDVAQAALYLMTSSWVTGQIHEIDGGRP